MCVCLSSPAIKVEVQWWANLLWDIRKLHSLLKYGNYVKVCHVLRQAGFTHLWKQSSEARKRCVCVLTTGKLHLRHIKWIHLQCNSMHVYSTVSPSVFNGVYSLVNVQRLAPIAQYNCDGYEFITWRKSKWKMWNFQTLCSFATFAIYFIYTVTSLNNSPDILMMSL